MQVAINGFGRIGRNFLRCWEGRKNTLLDVVAINDSGGVKQASHLLKYDSILGTFNADVKVVDDSTIAVNGERTPTHVCTASYWLALHAAAPHSLALRGTGLHSVLPQLDPLALPPAGLAVAWLDLLGRLALHAAMHSEPASMQRK